MNGRIVRQPRVGGQGEFFQAAAAAWLRALAVAGSAAWMLVSTPRKPRRLGPEASSSPPGHTQPCLRPIR
jgi:hypothetical protein